MGAGFGNHRDHLVVHLKPKACGNAQLLAGTEAALRVWLGKAAGVAILEAKTQAPSAPHDAGALERALDDLLVGQVAVRLAPSTPPRTRAMQQSIARRLQRHACIASAEATIFMKGSAG